MSQGIGYTHCPCGKVCSRSDKFCPQCGAKVNSTWENRFEQVKDRVNGMPKWWKKEGYMDSKDEREKKMEIIRMLNTDCKEGDRS